MFEIGFWELVLIGIIALVVLGPERLPGAARTLGQWAGRARSYLRHFTSELEREVGVQDLAKQARAQMTQPMNEIKRAVEEQTSPSSVDEKTPRD